MTSNIKKRRIAILEILKDYGFVKVNKLAKKFEVSEVTIRKDLSALELEGFLIRNYSGAVPIKTQTKVIGLVDLMCRAASLLIDDKNKIIIDNGTTTSAILPYLRGFNKLTLLTNSLSIANDVPKLFHDITLLVTGGTYDSQSQSLQGKQAENLVSSYSFDLFFTSADGIDINRGTTTFNEHVNLTRLMAQVSKKVVVLLSTQKIKNTIPNLELSWNDIDIVITDGELEPEVCAKFKEFNIELVNAVEMFNELKD